MINLKEIDYREFEKSVYIHYVEAFPRIERQSKKTLKKLYKENIIKFIKIRDETVDVGFMICAVCEGNPYVWLDYFAIYKEFQGQNYGTKGALLLKDFFSDYDGIYGEFEKEGLGRDKKENENRTRRAHFWKNVGFELLDIDLYLYGVVYSSCVLKNSKKNISNEQIVEYGFQLYKAVMGEDNVIKNCRRLKE